MNVPMRLRLKEARLLNPLIRELRLGAIDDAALPAFEPGAHVRVRVQLPDGSVDWRAYSLIRFEECTEGLVSEYRIAVRRDDAGRGGSFFMHEQLNIGDAILVERPRSDFAIGTHAGCAVLVAGGIGITPLISMAARRLALGLPVRLVYAGRSHAQLAYLDDLTAMLGSALQLHVDAEVGAPLDAAAMLGGCGPQDQLYVCGPAAMLEAVQGAATAQGWARERVHFEVFGAVAPQTGDQAFELVLAQSGRTLHVGANQSILSCLLEAGCDPMFDCQRGECGVCATSVLEGEIEHRDFVLTASERAAGNVIHTCVSRAKGSRLVLDL